MRFRKVLLAAASLAMAARAGEFDLGKQITDDLLAAGANCVLPTSGPAYELWKPYDGTTCTDGAGCDASIQGPILIPQDNNSCVINLGTGRLFLHSNITISGSSIKIRGRGPGSTNLYIAQTAPGLDNDLDLFTVIGSTFELKGVSVTNSYGITGITDNVRNGGAVIMASNGAGRVVDVTLRDTYDGFNVQSAKADGWQFRDITALTQSACPATNCMWHHLFTVGGVPQQSLTTAAVLAEQLYVDFRDTQVDKVIGSVFWIGAGIDTMAVSNATIYGGGYHNSAGNSTAAFFSDKTTALGSIPRWIRIKDVNIENKGTFSGTDNYEPCLLLYASMDLGLDSSSCSNASYGVYTQGSRKLRITNNSFANIGVSGVVLTPRLEGTGPSTTTIADAVLVQGNDFAGISKTTPETKSAVVVAPGVSHFQFVKNTFANLSGYATSNMLDGIELETGAEDDYVIEHNLVDTSSLAAVGGNAVANSATGTHKTCTLENNTGC